MTSIPWTDQQREAIETALALENAPPLVPEAAGRIGLARVLRAQATLLSGRPQQAWALLEPMGGPDASPLPSWGGAWLHLVRGQIDDALGRRAEALAEYRAVTALKGSRHNQRAGLIAKAAIRNPFQLENWREAPMVGAEH